MHSVDLVKKICAERGIAISRLERDCGFSNGYIRKLKEGKFPSDRLARIAEYLDVSYDYLLTGKEKGHPDGYYYDQEAADMAQQLFDDPSLRVLFDAARGSSPDDLKMAADLLKRLKGTNDG